MGICFPQVKLQFRILVLGISGSGKSTFTKQLRLIHEVDPFTIDELTTIGEILRQNIAIGMKELVEHSHKFGYEVDEENRRYVRFFRETELFEFDPMKEKKKIIALWKDPAIQRTWVDCRNNQIQMSSLDYLLDEENWERIIRDDYIPNDQDIVRARQRTTGAYSTRFKIDKSFWEFIDVGGQVPERSKWIKIVWEGVHSIIYVSALDEFNTNSSEQKGLTKMQISIEVWQAIVNDPENWGNSVVLFLNKTDLFEQKLQSERGFSDFIEKYPNYEEYVNNCNIEGYAELSEEEQRIKAAISLIEQDFRDVININNDNGGVAREVYVYHTCAIDQEAIHSVFNNCKDKIFIDRINASGIKF
eukprot:TRINITY_DN3740_c0_g2_i1.p1 TRINITY_DN3740_c0_g2~~TRINITY_DN3740_c0_g2_i1.p1  ORF type:complete len:360 (-),score=81.11 TRINITY_DN3740_c0_g2_i1:53-1132(-)